MKNWQEAAKDSVIPGILAGAVTGLAAAILGRRDTGSAMAAINAPSHVLWGDQAAAVEHATLRHTIPGYLINTAAAMFWSGVFEKFFGHLVPRRGLTTTLLGGAATAGAAYITDYYLVPRRFTPGFEKRVSGPSLLAIYTALGVSLAAGTLLVNERNSLRDKFKL